MHAAELLMTKSKWMSTGCVSFFFFFNDTATTEIYTLSLHDALPICVSGYRKNSSKLSKDSSPRE